MTDLAVFTSQHLETIDYSTFRSAGSLIDRITAERPAARPETSTQAGQKKQEQKLGFESKDNEVRTNGLILTLQNYEKIINQQNAELQRLRCVQNASAKHQIECQCRQSMLSSIEDQFTESINRLGQLLDDHYTVTIQSGQEVVLGLQFLSNELSSVTIRLSSQLSEMKAKESDLQEEIGKKVNLVAQINQEVQQLRGSEEERNLVIEQLQRRVMLSDAALKAPAEHGSSLGQEDAGADETEEVGRAMKEKLQLRDDYIHRQECTISSLQTQLAEERVKCAKLETQIKELSSSELQCKDQLAERLVLLQRVTELQNENEVLQKAFSIANSRQRHEIGCEREQYIKELAGIEEALENDLMRLQYQLQHATQRIKDLECQRVTLQTQVNKSNSQLRTLLVKMKTVIQERVEGQLALQQATNRVLVAEERSARLSRLIGSSEKEIKELKDKFEAMQRQ